MKWEADAAILKAQGREEGKKEGITIGEAKGAARQKAKDEKEKQGFIKSLIAGGVPTDKLYTTFGAEAVNSVISNSD